jgi:phage-related protein
MGRIIRFYRTSSNKCPLVEFLDSLPEKTLVKVLAVFTLVEDLERVPIKFFRKLAETKLYEIRVEWQSDIYRFPCFFYINDVIVLTHGFQKKKAKTPAKEIEKAEKYRDDFFRRNR